MDQRIVKDINQAKIINLGIIILQSIKGDKMLDNENIKKDNERILLNNGNEWGINNHRVK